MPKIYSKKEFAGNISLCANEVLCQENLSISRLTAINRCEYIDL